MIYCNIVTIFKSTSLHSACSIEEDTKYSGHNLYTTKGIKVGNMAGCASLCFEDSKCMFWTYNPRLDKYLTILPNISSQSVEVLDEDFRPGKESIHKGVDVRTKIMWSSR